MGKKKGSKRNGSAKNCVFKLLPQERAELTEIVDQLFKSTYMCMGVVGKVFLV